MNREIIAIIAAFTFLLSASTSALEKLQRVPGRVPSTGPDFPPGSTVTVSYYNLCTGAAWNWIGAPPFTTYGVRYDDVSEGDDVLTRTHMFFARGAPAGYGFTSIALVLPPFDPRCPGIPPQALEFFLPQDGWTTIEWNGGAGVPVEDFWILTTHSDAPRNPTIIVTERGQDIPAGQPGGCNRCFGPHRPTHSWFFGSKEVIVCPGIPWIDESPCFLELVWTSELRSQPVSVEAMSWGRVKSLYR
jgi:hypothetical protein